MSFEEGLLIFFILLILYFLISFILYRIKVFEKLNISFYGPLLMWRTNRGKQFINRISRKKRFWVYFANVGLVACFVLMVLMLFLLFSTVPIAFEAEDTIVSSNPAIALAVPGLNPVIPIGYGILAFVVALIVHEISHGILSRAQEIKVKSLGLLFLIIPIGAFCEPDEEELKKTGNKKRMRVFAAGPTANILTAFICLGVVTLMIISCVNPAADGVGVHSTVAGLPGEEMGLKPGMIITSINNTEVNSISEFQSVLNNTGANDTVEISYVFGKNSYKEDVKLADKYMIYYQAYEERYGNVNESVIENLSIFRNKGYLGVLATEQYKVDYHLLKNPFLDFPMGFLYYIGMPLFSIFNGYSSLNEPYSSFFIVDGFIPTDIFWIIINALYWIFWFNFLVASFNVLPMIPLDGGYMFNDLMDMFLKKFKSNLSKENREKITKNISIFVSFIILFIVLAPIIIPNIRGLF